MGHTHVLKQVGLHANGLVCVSACACMQAHIASVYISSFPAASYSSARLGALEHQNKCWHVRDQMTPGAHARSHDTCGARQRETEKRGPCTPSCLTCSSVSIWYSHVVHVLLHAHPRTCTGGSSRDGSSPGGRHGCSTDSGGGRPPWGEAKEGARREGRRQEGPPCCGNRHGLWSAWWVSGHGLWSPH